MSTLRRRTGEERGVALIVALMVLTVMLMLTTVVVSAAVNQSGNTNRNTKEARAFEAAQAGLQETLYRMNMQINSTSPTTAQTECLGPTMNANGTVSVDTEQLYPAFYASVACGPYTESLGDGAFYTSWTTIAYISSQSTCAGVSIGTDSRVEERCIAAQGIVCPPSYASVSQLPCPNEVTHRVEERVAAYAAKPVFPISGVFGLNGVLVKNGAKLLSNNGQPVVATNQQLSLQNTAQATGPALLAPSAPNPIILQSAQLGSPPPCTSTSLTFPSNCVQRTTTAYQPTPVVPPPASQVDGNARIANAFSPSYANPTTPHDTFSGCSSASSCGWDPTSRTLSLPNGVTWTIGGSEYNFCTLSLQGSSVALLPNTTGNGGSQLKTSIYIDSPPPNGDPTSGCPSGTGYLSAGQQSQIVNQATPLPGSTLPADTTAMELWVYGPSDVANPTYNNNACVNSASDPTCVSLGQGGDFYGTLYAPTSDVSIGNTGNNYGGVLGSTVTYSNPGTFTQDVNVTTLVTTAARALYFRSAWTDCAVQPTVVTNPMSGC
jgi:Tfp pilus assembly protein PilX